MSPSIVPTEETFLSNSKDDGTTTTTNNNFPNLKKPSSPSSPSPSISSPSPSPSTTYPTGLSARLAARHGAHTSVTSGLAPGYIQANLIVLPSRHAADFRALCQRNPVPCPLLAESASIGRWDSLKLLLPSSFNPTSTCPAAADNNNMDLDLRRDCPRYTVYRDGILVRDHVADVVADWDPHDHVAFLIGCSFSFERALADAGLAPSHVVWGRNCSMYRTNIPLCAAGVFGAGAGAGTRISGSGSGGGSGGGSGKVKDADGDGDKDGSSSSARTSSTRTQTRTQTQTQPPTYVVSMRPYRRREIQRVREITRRFGMTHGEPIAWGWDGARRIGIRDIGRPDWGDQTLTLEGGEVFVQKKKKKDRHCRRRRRHHHHDDHDHDHDYRGDDDGDDHDDDNYDDDDDDNDEEEIVPVFWGCGVTPQEAVMKANLDGTVMGHAPGHMLVLDVTEDQMFGRLDSE